jgi:GntR family transcriptional regulator
VARAYRILDEARIISTQQGRGTYITEIPPPDVSERLRHESLEALTQRFITEAIRLGFSERDVSQMVRDNLKRSLSRVEVSRKESNASNGE